MNEFVRRYRVVEGTGDSHQVQGSLSLVTEAGTPALAGSNIKYAAVVTGSAIGTVGKTTTTPEPAANTFVPVKFTNGNSAASPTLAFNGGPARVIQLAGAAPTAPELTVAAGGVAMFWFDGTVLHQLGVYA